MLILQNYESKISPQNRCSGFFGINLTNTRNKKAQVIFKNNLSYKAPLVGSRSNRFWKDLKKFRE